MMKGFALGKYVPYSSWVHRLDPRVKIATTILLMVAVFFPFQHVLDDGSLVNAWAMSYLMQAVMVLVISIILWSTHMSIRSVISNLRSLWFMVIFLLVIYCLVPYQNPTLGVAWTVPAFNNWTVYWDSFAEAGRILLRLVLMIELTMILTASTKPLDLTYAFEWYLSPLKILHFPAAEVAMTISIALRFIPTLLEDATRVMKAQSSRGVAFEHGSLFRRIAGVTSLIIPLFVSSFMRSEELANAMECRGYDPAAKRTKYRILKFHWSDLFAFLFAAIVMSGFITLSCLHVDIFALFGVMVP